MASKFIYCTRHRLAWEWKDEGTMKPSPPASEICPDCIAAKQRDPLQERTGTHTPPDRVVTRDVSDDEYLAGVRSPLARQLLLADRAAREHEHKLHDQALRTMDEKRPYVVEADRARTMIEKRKAHRRMMRAARGPRWIAPSS